MKTKFVNKCSGCGWDHYISFKKLGVLDRIGYSVKGRWHFKWKYVGRCRISNIDIFITGDYK